MAKKVQKESGQMSVFDISYKNEVKTVETKEVGGGKTKADLVQSKIFACVIEARDGLNWWDLKPERFGADCSRMSLVMSNDYWWIIHDKDYNQNGEIEHLHYHLVLRFPTRHTKTAVIKLLADHFAIKENRVSVEKCSSLECSLRYLVHEDEEDTSKYRYNPKEVHTCDFETFKLALENSLDKLSAEFLISVVGKSHKVCDIVRSIGAENYVKYRWLIHDLIKGLE